MKDDGVRVRISLEWNHKKVTPPLQSGSISKYKYKHYQGCSAQSWKYLCIPISDPPFIVSTIIFDTSTFYNSDFFWQATGLI